jgi:hypothetical protein
MHHALTMPAYAGAAAAGTAASHRARFIADAHAVPEELRIPLPPRARRVASPFRFTLIQPEAWWRQAMRWSLIGLTASWVAGEITLKLAGL